MPVPPVAHAHPVLLAGRVRHGLVLCGIIYNVSDLVHLPLAPVPGQGACQVPVVQDHHDQAPVPALMPALVLHPKCLQKAAVLVGQNALTLHHLM